MGLNPFVQMAFGCAPLYIRLAAFLSAVNASISCGGSWYFNVTLEPSTNLQLQQPRLLHVDNVTVVATSIVLPVPAIRVPLRSYIASPSCRCCCCSIDHRRLQRGLITLVPATTSPEVVCRRDVDDIAAFAQGSSHDDIVLLDHHFPRRQRVSIRDFWNHRHHAASYITGFPAGITVINI